MEKEHRFMSEKFVTETWAAAKLGAFYLKRRRNAR